MYTHTMKGEGDVRTCMYLYTACLPLHFTPYLGFILHLNYLVYDNCACSRQMSDDC